VFELKHIEKSFGANLALKDISFTIHQGEMVALIGPSGSGKTTLLKLLNAQHLPDKGSLYLDETEVRDTSRKKLQQLRQKIAYIPQDLGLVSTLKVYQNVLLGRIGTFSTPTLLWKFLFPNDALLEEIRLILESLGIAEKLFQQTSSLSGGQQQRVAVARALFQKAHTILADEPVSAVDPARAKSLVTILKEISEKQNISVVMSIHNIDIATNFFPRIIGLQAGQLVLDSAKPTADEIDQLYQLDQQNII